MPDWATRVFARVKLGGAVLTDVVADGASFEGATGLTTSTIEYLKSNRLE